MSGLQRLEDWPERLHALVEQRLQVPFRWGSNDCVMFAADAVQALTGVDLAGRLRGQYDDEPSARKIGLAYAGADEEGSIAQCLSDIATLNLGDLVLPSLARRGDVVLIEHDAGQSLAVCLGPHAAAPGRRGLMMLPPEHWLTAWRVG